MKIADDLPRDVREEVLALTIEGDWVAAPLEITAAAIQHLCEVLEDGNPLYLDATYARAQGYENVVAPPASLFSTFILPFRWPGPQSDIKAPRKINDRLKDILGLPVAIQTQADLRFYGEMAAGQRIMWSDRLVSLSEWKRTRLGEGRFWDFDTILRDEGGRLVARDRKTIFGYGKPTLQVEE